MNDNNNISNEPSSNADSMPKGGGVFQKGRKIAVKAKNGIKDGIARAVNELWKRLTIKQKAIVIAVIVLICLIVFVAALLMSMISETSTVASQNVDDFMATSEDIDERAKELFDEKSSLLALKITDVNNIFNKLVIDQKGGSETQNLMQYQIGENEVSDDKENERIVDINDKIPLYKHILMTEKYNFNSIKWKKYTHSGLGSAKDVDNFKEDKEKGLKYPDDSKFEDGSANSNPMKLEKFMDLTLPYLQTWYIPLAMSNASVINGKEEESNRAPAFSYNIIKEAYSNLIVNWYEIKTHTLNTKYYTYDKVKKHDELFGIEVIERIYEDGSKQYSYRTNRVSEIIGREEERISMNTATSDGLASGENDPMKEEYVSEKDDYKSNFYLKEADVFDAKIINDFNYQVYSDADAQNRRNPNSKSESTSSYGIAAENVGNMARFARDQIGVRK